MIPSGPHKFKNALSDSIIFLDKEFDLVLDVGMPPASRGGKPCFSVIAVKARKILFPVC
jgi:hypothetical protein